MGFMVLWKDKLDVVSKKWFLWVFFISLCKVKLNERNNKMIFIVFNLGMLKKKKKWNKNDCK